ncbi:YncE family protein [Aquimarina algicola]|uniref:YncE family protein n=1 Tax=Aquimarina algicola TaxID=2589995 RepID=A0A504J6I7_9FLAO|nr:YncE family protein [Aquimarina algicola]TPN82320.1 YncE family protein [Aquimarina algicola]
MNFKKLLYTGILFGLILSSCSDDDDSMQLPRGEYDNGILISHEGSFSGVSGQVSFVSNDFSDTQDDIYNTVNNETLGIFQQSIGFKDDLAFIVVDNANTITVVNRFTFEKVDQITTGLQTPRYISFIDDKGYVTNWGDTSSATDDFIAIIDLSDYTVSTTIPVSEGPEQMLIKDGLVYVSHKGGFGSNNIVSVIDSNNSNAVKEVEVGDNPDELAFDTAGNIWVLCGGKTDFSVTPFAKTSGTLVKINTSDQTVATTINFTGEEQPELMAYYEGNIYYTLNSKVYKMDESATTLPTESVIDGSFYGMSIRDNKLYAVDAKDFSAKGELKIFDLSNNQETNSFDMGVVPAKIYFN